MRTNQKWWPAFLLATIMALPFAAVAQPQTTTTTAVNKFEIIAVDGNNLVVRNEKGTHHYVVPDDFRFTVDGKKLSVNELKPGMKGTATVTTKTTTWPVTVTEIKEGTVVSATNFSVNVRSAEGVRRFTQEQLDDRGVQILKDGRIVHIRDLRKGDLITATFISKAPPVVLTETEVQAALAQTASPTPAAPTPAAATPAAAAPAPAAAQTTTPPPASPEPAKASPAQPQAAGGTPWIWYILIAIALALLWFFLARKKEKR
jgi:cell division septation protein DedD